MTVISQIIMCYPKHISLVKFVSPTREHIHCITSDMYFLGRGKHITTDICFPGRGTHGIPGKHIPRDMCSPGRGTDITRDMCFPEKGTHRTSDMCGMVREHISIRICVSQVVISVPGVGEHISLGISLLCHSDMCSPVLSEMCFPYKRNSNMCSPTWEACFPGKGTHFTKDVCFPSRGTLITSGISSPSQETKYPW